MFDGECVVFLGGKFLFKYVIVGVDMWMLMSLVVCEIYFDFLIFYWLYLIDVLYGVRKDLIDIFI